MVTTGTRRLQDQDNHTDPDAGAGDAVASCEHVMDLLEEHVPISLLMDLVAPAGPDSEDILTTEGAPDEAWWEPGA